MHPAHAGRHLVLHRGAGEGHAEGRLELEGRLGDLAGGVLDRLCLVQDDRVPLHLGETGDVEAEEGIAGVRRCVPESW